MQAGQAFEEEVMLPKPPKGWGFGALHVFWNATHPECARKQGGGGLHESARAPGSPSCLPGPLGPPSPGPVSAGEAGPLPSTQSPQAPGPPSSQPHGEPGSSPHECGPQGPTHLGGGTTPLRVCVQSWESRKLNWPVVHASLHHRRLHLLTGSHLDPSTRKQWWGLSHPLGGDGTGAPTEPRL